MRQTRPGSLRGGRASAALFTAAIFASAFLIFLVQPMVGKRILPWFGGAPAVWTLCLAFYQTTLFAGYAYAHLLVRFASPTAGLALHAALFAVALWCLPVLPDPARQPVADGTEPGAAILALLAVHVAVPFLLLAATAPLVQAWWGRRHPGRSPYPLYAVSNLGSLLALLGYPFLLEPRLSLSTTGRLWSLLFAGTGVAVLGCAALARRADSTGATTTGGGGAPPSVARIALWCLLPGCAVVLLMAVTNELCLDVASVPFLWILPLSAYLLSFILCFGSPRAYRRGAALAGVGALLLGQYLVALWALGDGAILALASSVQLQIAVHCALLLGACTILHGELHRLRPPAGSLTFFYLCVAGGGALGGLGVGLVAPRVFDHYYELQLGLGLACLLLWAACWHDSQGWLRRGAPRWQPALAACLTLLLLAGLWGQAGVRPASLLHQERTFFGVLSVRQLADAGGPRRLLFHGTTLHGVQLQDAERRPTSYFGVATGIGLAMAQREPGVGTEIGVVGLGIGTLAAYGRPGDRFRFYEIDPAVIRLARNEAYFSYLAQSPAAIEIVEGDARLSLAAERARGAAPRFDLLVIDAFSSDAIPVHLLTREAFRLYLDSLEPGGLLAVQATNRHFDLLPLVARLGASEGLGVVAIENAPLPRQLSAFSRWLFLSRDQGRLRSLERLARRRLAQPGLPRGAIRVRHPPADLAEVPLWTDDYSDLFGALRPLRLRLQIGGR